MDHRRGDLGGRQEAGVGNGEQQLRLGIVLHQQGKGPVVRRTGGSADALGHLLLDQHRQAVEALGLHAGGKERCGDVIGQIGTQNGP